MSDDRRAVLIGGDWREGASNRTISVVNPATDETLAELRAAGAEDVDAAVRAAAGAQPGWAATPVEDRIALLDRIAEGVRDGAEALAAAVTSEMGSPLGFSRAAQVGLAMGGLRAAAEAARGLSDERVGRSLVQHNPVGVVGAITPWNFPLHQIIAKTAPALAAGCAVVLKSSEVTPLDAILLARIIQAAGVPDGVFNLVTGDRQTGEALVRHPGVDMVSFTGSTRGGRAVAMAAAEGLKKTALELGGKSANIVLDDADLARAIPGAAGQVFVNSGQVCAALPRLLVPRHRLEEAEALARAAAESWTVGDPLDPATRMGPVATGAQQASVRRAIDGALAEGARLVAGGPEQPEGLPVGAYVRPTVLADVDNAMAIAREETFGPVLLLMGYDTEDEAVRLANDSDYGLSGGVWSDDPERALAVARRLRTGQVVLNGATLDLEAPFGGVRQSGLGRENGRHGLMEFLAPKAITSAAP